MDVGGSINNPTIPASLQAQSFYHFGNHVLPVYCALHDGVTRWNATDGIEPAKFDEVLHFKLKNMIARMYQGLTVLQKYFNVMQVFNYDTNNKRVLWMRKNKRQLERALEVASTSPMQRIRQCL